MSRHLEARNQLVNWQVAPAEFEIANYDFPKITYRQSVEKLIDAVPKKSLKKKTFVTIATNVLCADISSSKDTIDPIDRDIYLPLEIALTKWSVSDSGKSIDERTHTTQAWIMKPGDPPKGCVNYAINHKGNHSIAYDKFDDEQDTFLELDLQKIIKEINSFLTPDRTVYSLSLKNCRQDLGSLKWLNRETGYKTKPINVYSLEDLYVVLIRSLSDDENLKLSICQGLARHRMEFTSDTLDPKMQCRYHKDRLSEDESSLNCAKALTVGYTMVLLDDIRLCTEIFDANPSSSPEKHKKAIGT